jgi:hypothetical protein
MRRLWRSWHFDQSAFVQNSGYGRSRRDATQQAALAQLALNGARANQSNLASSEPLASLNDHSSSMMVVARCYPIWATGLTLESFPTELVEAFFPFEQPSTSASDQSYNSLGTHSLEYKANRPAAKVPFSLLVHDASFAGSMN